MVFLSEDLLADSRRWRAFAEQAVAPLADEHDRERCVRPDLISRFAAGDMLWLPPGPDRMVRLALLHEEVGRFCIATRSLLTVHGMTCYLVERFGTPSQQERWLGALSRGELLGAFALSEPEAGSDLNAIRCRAERTAGGWRIDGVKMWTSFAQIANLFVVLCTSGEGPVALVVERDAPGFRVVPTSGELLAARGSMLGELSFDDCRVAAEALLGPPGLGIGLVAANALMLGRISVAAGAIGMMRRCLELSRAFGESRVQFGTPIAHHQAIAAKLSAMIIAIEAGRDLCLNAAGLADRGNRLAAVHACMAKHFAARSCVRAASDAVQIHGARGFLREHEVFRLYQDSKLAEVIEGSSEIQDNIIAGSGYAATPAASGGETE